MKYTTNLNLKKPDYSDQVDIEDINYNMDIIDSKVGNLSGLTTTIANKVDKEAGKRLITDAEASKLAGIAAGAQVNTVTSVAGKTGAVTVTKADVGLPNVDNVKQMPITGGTFTGKTIFQNNGDYSKQGRNITLSTADPSGGASGDVWIKYKA